MELELASVAILDCRDRAGATKGGRGGVSLLHCLFLKILYSIQPVKGSLNYSNVYTLHVDIFWLSKFRAFGTVSVVSPSMQFSPILTLEYWSYHSIDPI